MRPTAPRPRSIALAVVLALTVPAAASGSAEWTLSPPLAPAVQQAKARGKLVLIKVTTNWCPSCRKLDRVLEETAVRAGLAGFVRLAYDAEQGEGKDVAQRYNVVAYPTLLVVGGDGREQGRLTGDLPGPELLERLQRVRSGAESLARLEAEARRSPADLKLRLRAGTEWAFRGSRAGATAHLDAVIAGDPQNQKGLAAEALLVKGKYLLLRSLGDNAAAVATLRELRSRFAGSAQAGPAGFALAQALHRLGNSREALQLLSAPARSAEDHDGVAWFCLRERTAYARGLEHARRAVVLDGKQADYWATLAELQLRLGQRAQAQASWQRARALDPGSPRTRGPLPAAQ